MVLQLSSETSTLKCSQKYFFRSTAKLKCRKIKILDQKVKVKCREKKQLICEKKQCFRMQEKNQTWQPLITQTGRAMKKLLWNEEKHVWNREIPHEAIYADLHKRKLSPSPGLFLLELPSHCRHFEVYFISFFCSTLKQN